jgi:hypothetical protein
MSWRNVAASWCLALALAAWPGGPAAAQGVQIADCRPGNLMAGRLPRSYQDIRGDRALVTDQAVAPEGAQWNSAPAVTLETGAASLTWDLGAVYALQAIYVQADANDVYHLWGSTDGQSYRPLPDILPAEGVHGLRSRKLAIGGTPVRFLRFGDGVGDAAYSVSEVAAFCQLPDPFPPPMRLAPAPPAEVQKSFFSYWNNDVSARWELALALLGLGLLLFGAELRRVGKAELYRKARDRALLVMGVLSLFTYFNFGFAHFGNLIHDWEWTHYYVGSKYFRELSYDRLYECIAIADAEEGAALRHRVETRKITNLRTNALEPAGPVLEHPERCKEHFTENRWQAFKHDVGFFRNRQSARRWDDLQTDHGYNGTPVWNIAGTLLSNLGPASTGQLYTLALLDPLYLLGLVALVVWAFGWRVACVGLLVFATNFPSRFYWTGGSFLRWDWLFYLVAAICCLKKERPLLAGMALAYSTLLRIFPVFVFAGPVLAAGWGLYRTRRLERSALRFFAGAALAVALLVPLSMQVGGGMEAYRRFAQNTAKHKETPLTNYMGLRTVIAYRPGESGRDLRSDRYTDPWIKWKEARLRGYREARPAYFLLALGFLALIGFAVRGRPLWQATALGVTFIPFGVELTCYYYAFIIGVALLYSDHDWIDEPEVPPGKPTHNRVGQVLLLVTAFTGVVDLFPIGLDEKYTWMSVATLFGFGLIVWDFGLARVLAARAAARAGTAASPPGGAAPVAGGPTSPAEGAETPAPRGGRARVAKRSSGGERSRRSSDPGKKKKRR